MIDGLSLITAGLRGVEVQSCSFIEGMKDPKTGEPINAIELDGVFYVTPKIWARLQSEITAAQPHGDTNG